MKATIAPFLLLIAGLALGQERCDAPSPSVFCNTTEILAYETSDCRPFQVFVTRGSDEPYPGRLGNLTREICSGIGGTDECGFENVVYPAKSTSWGTDVWCDSAGQGAVNGQAQMKAYSEKCPDSKLILLGFSQGGAVAQDILGGGGGKVFACEQDANPAMDPTSSPGANVVAAVTFGAVVRSKYQNFTVGEGADYDGQAPRTPEQLAGLLAYSDVLLDYCHYGDPMCAVGSEPADVYVHLDYFLEHNEEVKKWVVAMAKASDGTASGKPSKPTISSTSTSVAAKSTVMSTAMTSTVAVTSATATASVPGDAEAVKQVSPPYNTGAAGSLTPTAPYMPALAFLAVLWL
ncbi:alpha/beta-hydrolase [Decorospora gaudefroyi]|uniref:Alpha/beta-hydrolase n=1 Tax=Decorospora gaudefroyi TaxID=184978 RepID=A0A6A5K3W9_9PLEO|nr:alpha/beta-hydrolase [Decorospora gaudefroyi]